MALFSQRKEWADVKPIPMKEPEYAAATINYSEEFEDAMGYFRTILKTGEKSQRVLDLTLDVIFLNPGNYTAWLYRRETLLETKASLEKERDLMDSVAHDFMKCYQYWYHRRFLVEKTGDYAHELRSIALSLREDSKNYHAWALRQWVVQTFGCYDEELKYTEILIKEDVRNNSAWNYRLWVCKLSGDGLTKPVREREIKFAREKIRQAPNNESAWSYLLGIWRAGRPSVDDSNREAAEELLNDVKEVCTEFVEKSASVFARSALVDVLEFEGDRAAITKATEILTDLAETLDTIRARYWLYRKRNAERILQLMTSG